MWYKNAALIERTHPMIAGFFRLKERRARRPGFAIDPIPVHLWKRTKEVFRLFVSWAKFFKEMEEIWLQTRPRSDMEKRCLEEIQKIQGEIWQALKIAEWQRVYNDAKAALPTRARALLDPFEDLSSKMLRTRRDLDAFLAQWRGLQTKLVHLYRRASREEGAWRWLDQLSRLHREAREGLRIREWQEAYSEFRARYPRELRLLYAKFDALSNRVVYSRQDLRNVWASTREQLRGKRFWNIEPWRLAVTLLKELSLTTTFVRRIIASFHSKDLRFANLK
jgi:hypothetical protein